MSAVELWIDFARKVHCRYTGERAFDLWLSEEDRESPVRRFPGESLRGLIQ